MLPAFQFNERAAVEAILYIADRSKHPTFHRIAKLLYFADRLHLERYGRFICGDRYVAMRNGPVPSGVYDMLKAARNGISFLSFPDTAEAFSVHANYHVKPHRQADADWLSDSDIECLDEVIEEYGGYSFSRLTELSHDAAWQAADENDFISIEAIANTLNEPDILIDYLKNPNP